MNINDEYQCHMNVSGCLSLSGSDEAAFCLGKMVLKMD